MSSDIMAGNLDVRCVRTPTAYGLSSCNNNLLPFSLGRDDLMAKRTAYNSLKMMSCSLSLPLQKPLTSTHSLRTAPQP